MSTTDGSVRVHQAPNLPSDHAPEQIKQQQPPSRGPATYFPLGYKEAAYQWVSYPIPLLGALENINTNLFVCSGPA
jgi:hypothetical protein